MRLMVCAGALALALVSMPGAGHAQDGLAGMHTWARIGGRTCMADHFHDGSGSGTTRAAAARNAIQAWQSFTAWEYSARWARYGSAVSRKLTCSGSRGSFSCNVSARPCRG